MYHKLVLRVPEPLPLTAKSSKHQTMASSVGGGPTGGQSCATFLHPAPWAKAGHQKLRLYPRLSYPFVWVLILCPHPHHDTPQTCSLQTPLFCCGHCWYIKQYINVKLMFSHSIPFFRFVYLNWIQQMPHQNKSKQKDDKGTRNTVNSWPASSVILWGISDSLHGADCELWLGLFGSSLHEGIGPEAQSMPFHSPVLLSSCHSLSPGISTALLRQCLETDQTFLQLHLWTCRPGRARLPVHRFTVNLNFTWN